MRGSGERVQGVARIERARRSEPNARTQLGGPPLPYLRGLDGLRAIAVLAVVAYHLGWSGAPGGFLGVDVFFVLSGYLITALLVDEQHRTGRIDLRRFLARRARRLLPALWAMLLAVCTVAVLAAREELSELRRDVPAAAAYLSNWATLTDDLSYFETAGRPPLLAHLWSLAIEGQFYVLWPAALVVLLPLAARRTWAVAAPVALAGAALSTTAMVVLAMRGAMPVPHDPSPVYLATHTHAMGLLLGAALGAARWPGRGADAVRAGTRGSWALELAGWAGLAGLALAFWRVGALDPALYRGGFALVSVLALATVAAISQPRSRLGAALGVGPLRYLGQRSYGIYLWHWPVLMLTRPGFELPVGGVVAGALRVGLTLALAEACYRWIEVPVRRGALGRWIRRDLAGTRAVHGLRGFRLVAAPGSLAVLVVVLAVALATAPVAAPSAGAPTSIILRPTPAASGHVGPPPGGPRAPRGADPAEVFTAASAGGAVRAPRSVTGAVVAAADVAAAAADTAAVAEAAAVAASSAASVAPPTTVVGDSVLAAIAPALVTRFPAVEIDAVTSRQPAEVLAALGAIAAAGRLGQVVVIGAGTNGAIAEPQLRAMLDLAAGARRVLVLNNFVDRDWEAHNNAVIAAVVPAYANAVVVDWNALATAHPEWLWTDRIHPRPAGAEGVATVLLDEAVRVAG